MLRVLASEVEFLFLRRLYFWAMPKIVIIVLESIAVPFLSHRFVAVPFASHVDCVSVVSVRSVFW